MVVMVWVYITKCLCHLPMRPSINHSVQIELVRGTNGGWRIVRMACRYTRPVHVGMCVCVTRYVRPVHAGVDWQAGGVRVYLGVVIKNCFNSFKCSLQHSGTLYCTTLCVCRTNTIDMHTFASNTHAIICFTYLHHSSCLSRTLDMHTYEDNTHTHTHTHTRTYTHIHTHTHTNTHTHSYTHTQYTNTHTHTHTLNTQTHTYTHTHTHTHIHTNTHANTHANTHTHML